MAGRTRHLTIRDVEAQTRISKDTLRIWERRYGFPVPVRDANGQRVYGAGDVARLKLIKRLLERGHRPGQVVGRGEAELKRLATAPARAELDGILAADPDIERLLTLVQARRIGDFRPELQQLSLRLGLQRFLHGTLRPLLSAVALAAESGVLAPFEERLINEQIATFLKGAIAGLPPYGAPPRVVLATPPGEGQAQGLLMLEAVLALEGAACLSLGTSVPLEEIAAAALLGDVVLLVIGEAWSPTAATELLATLRRLLPKPAELWVGGAGVRRLLKLPEGTSRAIGAESAAAALEAWRRR